MKSLILLILVSIPVLAQTAADPVVATIDGHAWKRSEFDAMARNLAPEIVTGYNANKAAWLEQFALMTRLAAIAKKEGIDQREPYKQQIDYNNMMFLAQAMMDYRAGNAPVTPEVKRAWLDAHKNDYRRARVKGILVRSGQDVGDGKKPRTDAEAMTVVEGLIKRINAGESIGTLAKEYSEEPKSKAKDGDFPIFRFEDTTITQELKDRIFSTKAGALTGPIKLTKGVYVFKVEAFVDPTVEELGDEIYIQVGREKALQWLEQIRKETKLEINDPAYFGASAGK